MAGPARLGGLGATESTVRAHACRAAPKLRRAPLDRGGPPSQVLVVRELGSAPRAADDVHRAAGVVDTGSRAASIGDGEEEGEHEEEEEDAGHDGLHRLAVAGGGLAGVRRGRRFSLF
eukprot:CAMPEP_0206007976 /NCGR_PEP_ID=MMETSP1464-20131121/6560_1 /ASSEMBLY_ACC=CAM_ASM_001124 /TAXON_ID=119497 /ORGANISM="Exanthemachrysis gayraliae, Strain RCC1523" /LENGTH=117 /DNA_ID=CAMNT_0053381495 /DNA_START=163 /DNA_END=513 /DNA_ORIENTATION=-